MQKIKQLLKPLLLLSFIFLVVALIYLWLKSHNGEKNLLVLYGNVDVRQADLGFRVGGRLDALYFEEGDLVKKEQKMALLDQAPYIDLVNQAKASVMAAKVNFNNAKTLLERRLDLVKDGSISKEDLDNAQSSHDALEAKLAEAEAALALAETNLKDTVIYAPTDGTILTRIREPGTIVKEGDPVLSLSILSPVWVRAFIAEPGLGMIYPGMKADIYTDTPDGKVYHGHVGFISPTAEFTPKTVETTDLRTDLVYRLRIIADNPDKGLKQGMPVTVKLLSEKKNSDHN